MALAQVSKNKVVNEMALMEKWLNKMAEEVSDAKRVTKTAMRRLGKTQSSHQIALPN